MILSAIPFVGMAVLLDLVQHTSWATGTAIGAILCWFALEIAGRRFNLKRDGRDILPPAIWGRIGLVSFLVLTVSSLSAVVLFGFRGFNPGFLGGAIIGFAWAGSFTFASMSVAYRHPLPAETQHQKSE